MCGTGFQPVSSVKTLAVSQCHTYSTDVRVSVEDCPVYLIVG